MDAQQQTLSPNQLPLMNEAGATTPFIEVKCVVRFARHTV
jgi:hypothetical protein